MSRRRRPPPDAFVPRPTIPDGSVRRRRFPRAARSDAGTRFTVTDTWPAAVPVTAREVEVVETYLGALLDEILREAAPDG
ncbi:hypothetical protein NS226_17420 [Aureimonas ureilytica]|uniref:Uncharacterized protein n=1 Tax=Aureimonas ureilytica TaxID=401562 RepID=A0A175R4F5_9HYPH|nr:hypothetical protein [Aureimonas ureilytica]KTQ88027.1 hypothetical protein NS226_17420 [Aureimonas ureilytica]